MRTPDSRTANATESQPRGEHIHHGYFLDPKDTKEIAQTRLIDLLIDRAGLGKGSPVLDVGCGIGGTSRYLARNHDCHVTGITISGKQVEMAMKLSREQTDVEPIAGYPIKVKQGTVHFLELDAEKMGNHFSAQDTFGCVWISEAMSHLPDKQLFFANAFKVLQPGGKLAIADWFKAEDLTDEQLEADIKPIEGFSHPSLRTTLVYQANIIAPDGMLLPPLCTQPQYVRLAQQAGFEIASQPLDISAQVAKTW